MLIGHVSDEDYVALPGVAVEVARDGETIAVAHSTASGAIHADVEPGEYELVLAHDGHGSKRVRTRLPREAPLRLLSDGPLGYAWPKWVRAPQSSELRVHAAEPFKVDLWRYGQVREHVGLLGWFDEHGPRAMRQILPDADVTQTGAQWNRCGYTSPGHVRHVPAPERSGLYYFHVTLESGAFTSFPWVVAPRAATADVAVLASTNTWNAYNAFGGRSNYINADGLPPRPTVNARQDLARYVHGNEATHAAPNRRYPPLSFDRPEPACRIDPHADAGDPAPGRVASSLAPGLWRLLAWLEREGYDHDLWADAHLHSGALDLDAYRVLVLDMHPEYWSRTMYEKVKAWVRRGGRLAYLGGNGIDCEVEFHGDAVRHLTCQSGEPEEAGFESRFHRTVEPASSLLGVTFTHAGEGTAAPYEVRDAEHWAFSGTGLAAGDRFGGDTLHERVPGGASGHETDKRTAHTPAGARLLAKGLNPDGGGAEMIHFELPGGGAVFSVGSMTYVPSLLVDRQVSAITRNVLDRFLEPAPPGGNASGITVEAGS